jgi:hypothetical protein
LATVGQVGRSIQRFGDYAQDLLRSDMNTFDNALNILLDFCETDPVFSSIHKQLQSVPEVDFDEWYEGRLASGGSMVGSCDLTFPTDPEIRMSLMYELLRRIRDGRVDFVGFATSFFALGTTKITPYVQAFNDAVTRPLVRELNYRLEELNETLPSDRSVVVPQSSIQIIHRAQNVIHQSAIGTQIQQNATQVVNPELVRLFDRLDHALQSLEDYRERQQEYSEIVTSARELAMSESPKPSAVKALLTSLPQIASVTSIVASILNIIGG